MKKLITTAALALGLLAAPGVASAGVNVSVGIGLPFPGFAVVAPPPVVYGPRVVYPARAYYGPVYAGPRYVYGGYRGRPCGWRGRHWKRHW